MTSLTGLSALAPDSDRVAPGLLGFLVVAAIGAATWFLIKSMNKQLKKIDFDESETTTRHSGDGAGNATKEQ